MLNPVANGINPKMVVIKICVLEFTIFAEMLILLYDRD